MTSANLRVRIGSVPLDALTLTDAIQQIVHLVDAGCGGTVYTPNVDHVVVAERDPDFRNAYAQASLSLVDGTPVLWAARLLGFALPEKVSGSDLFEPLLERAAQRGLRVFFVGGAPGVAAQARDNLCARYRGLRVAGIRSPLIDTMGNAEDEESLLEEIRVAAPSIVFVACGAPKSELFSHRHRVTLRPAVLVCVGAAIDFAAGTARRAPRWMSRFGFEWIYRLCREPRRLASRYLLRDPKFLWIFGRQFVGSVAGGLVTRLLPAAWAAPRRSLLEGSAAPPRSETRAIPGAVREEEVAAESGVLEATEAEVDLQHEGGVPR